MLTKPEQGVGCVSADDVIAVAPLPQNDVAALDGWAIDGSHVAPQIRLLLNGHVSEASRNAVPAIAIYTGAPMPPGTDRIVPIEYVTSGCDLVSRPPRHHGVRRAGVECDVGDVLVGKGLRFDHGAMATVMRNGITEVNVIGRPRIGIAASGDELMAGATRDVNTPGIQDVLARNRMSSEALPMFHDGADATLQTLRHAQVMGFDVLITTGGTSVGRKDYVVDTLKTHGRVIFHRVAVLPGMPTAVGQFGDKLWVVCLPGQPLSAWVCAWLFAVPLVHHLEGSAEEPMWVEAVADPPLHAHSRRLRYVAGILTSNGQQLPLFRSLAQNSAMTRPMTQCNALAEIPPASGSDLTSVRVRLLPN